MRTIRCANCIAICLQVYDVLEKVLLEKAKAEDFLKVRVQQA